MTGPHLPDPRIEISADGTPRSGVSGDVYFSVDGGVEEARHVFLGGMDAPDVWKGRARFRIGELGFGTGLNFLVTWHDWARAAPAPATLDYMAIEGFPIDKTTLSNILERVPDLRHESRQLVALWPLRVAGVHRLEFQGGRVRLTLMFGEVEEMLAATRGQVDAWYLDGFAPSKNPDMWSTNVLDHVARLSAPGARLATFTAAGAVRRGLESHGFRVEKRAGFGRKRDCIRATYVGSNEAPVCLPPGARIGIVGAGIAGGCLARALANRGLAPILIDKASAPGHGASGNPAALLAPRLPRERIPMGRVMASAYLHALRFYDSLGDAEDSVWLGSRGAFVMARSEGEEERQSRAVRAFGWPGTVMRCIGSVEASELTRCDMPRGGLWFAGAGTLGPPAITAHLATCADYRQADVAELRKSENCWRLIDDAGAEIVRVDALVIAAGAEGMRLVPGAALPVRANRGQLSYVPEIVGAPRAPITFGGYLTPLLPLPGGASGHVLGATYARRDEVPEGDWAQLRDEDDVEMRRTMAANLPGLTPLPSFGGRTALRATVRDYMPIAGAIEDGVYVFAGLGSRGFMTAPLMADLLADMMTAASLPLEADLVDAVSPSRFR